MKKNKINVRVIAVIAAAVVLLAGCGRSYSSSQNNAAESSYYDTGSYKGDSDYGTPMAATETAAYEEAADYDYAADSASGSSTEPKEAGIREAQDGEKIIYTANLEMQTLGYDETVRSIRRKITAAGGFIESEYESDNNSRWYEESSSGGTRYLKISIRVPSENFNSFLESLEGDGKIKSRSVNARNISQVYSDTETTKKALEIERDRLLEMMDRAETIEDMITVEARLSEVERELNQYRTQLSGMDRDVQYSTININLQEVKRYSPSVQEKTYMEKLQEAAEDAVESFREFMEDLSLFVVRNFPFLVLLALLILFIRWRIRRGREKKLRRLEEARAAGMPVDMPAGRKRRFFKKRGEPEKYTAPGNYTAPDNYPAPENSSDPAITAGPDGESDGKETK